MAIPHGGVRSQAHRHIPPVWMAPLRDHLRSGTDKREAPDQRRLSSRAGPAHIQGGPAREETNPKREGARMAQMAKLTYTTCCQLAR